MSDYTVYRGGWWRSESVKLWPLLSRRGLTELRVARDSLGESVVEDRVRQRFPGEEQIPGKEEFWHGQSSARKLIFLKWLKGGQWLWQCWQQTQAPSWRFQTRTVLWSLNFIWKPWVFVAGFKRGRDCDALYMCCWRRVALYSGRLASLHPKITTQKLY